MDWSVEGQDRNIQLIAYSPLASGLLTDKALTRSDGKATKVYSYCYMN
jgi:aryl-alcohol dehydrogenase-like predicted oxidoreductase